MYTGIVQTLSEIKAIEVLPGLKRLAIAIDAAYLDNISIGASIAVDGVCLTVTRFDLDQPIVSFDVMQQTLSLTQLDHLVVGDKVNVERSAGFNQEVGGHILSGHIDGEAKVVEKITAPNNVRLRFEYPAAFDHYLFDKGFVALNGCSLTLADVNKSDHQFDICYIPETLSKTNHGLLEVGDLVNLELDRQTQTIVDTVERILLQKQNN